MTSPFRPNRPLISLASLAACLIMASIAMASARAAVQGEDPTSHDGSLRDPDHFYSTAPPPPEQLSDWQRRRDQVQQKLLISTGLWPQRPRSPLHPRVFDRRQGEGFSVAKVYFESLPGFFVTGNLYQPAATRTGRHPAILMPHGHWEYGRLQNTESGSIPARAIDFARQGYIVLSIDMVGYNDSFQLPHDPFKSRAQLKADRPVLYEPHRFRGDFDFPRARLYGFNLAGLQLWNGIRALDFLMTLPEVDEERVGVTGASGGATQSLLLMAADPRVRVAAPVNIIGSEKHPGCRCENPPGLWVHTSTLELAAVFAPRPLLLVSATEDPWTHSTPQREYPQLRQYYELFDASENIANVHVNAGHNYNAESRQAVYEWFRRHLAPPGPPVADPSPVAVDLQQLGDLRVFPEGRLPENARSAPEIIEDWIETSKETIAGLSPDNPEEVPGFAREFRPALALVLGVADSLHEPLSITEGVEEKRGAYEYRTWQVREAESGSEALEIEMIHRQGSPFERVVLAAYPENWGPLLETEGQIHVPWLQEVLARNSAVFRVRGYASRQKLIPQTTWDSLSWSESYNLTNEALQVRDLLLALRFVRSRIGTLPLTLAGLDDLGLAAIAAAGVSAEVDLLVVDLHQRGLFYDGSVMQHFPIAAFQGLGGFQTALLLQANRGDLRFFNLPPDFTAEALRSPLREAGLEVRLFLETESSVRGDFFE